MGQDDPVVGEKAQRRSQCRPPGRNHGGSMSFSINTNLAANTALNNVTDTQNQLNKSITELSTGLQINSAADNPAGLIISQRFQAQIGGLNQAITNSQDAVNYAKTADGGLAQISSMLNTARSLAVAAANNATLTSSA